MKEWQIRQISHKRHLALSYNLVQDYIASGVIYFMYIAGKLNTSDVLALYLGWAKFWALAQPILFCARVIDVDHPNVVISPTKTANKAHETMRNDVNLANAT
jgi:hypothetical protein